MRSILTNNQKQKKYDIVTVGEILVDMISTEYSNDFNCDTYRRFFGGSPSNIAMNTKNLGINSNVICCVGNDGMGDFLIKEMEKRGIDTSNVQRVDYPTSMVFLTKSKSSPVPIFYRGADYHIDFNESVKETVKNAKIVHFSAWPISREPSRSTIENIIKVARENNTVIGFDPNYHPALWKKGHDGIKYIKEIIKKVDIIKPSEDDARRLFGEGTIEQYLDKFLDLGPKLVIMTLGKNGLIASDGEETIKLASMAEEVVDTTGAGDAFWSGFYTAIIKWFNTIEAIKLGNATSAYKLRHMGAVTNLPKIETIKTLYGM